VPHRDRLLDAVIGRVDDGDRAVGQVRDVDTVQRIDDGDFGRV